MRYTSSTEFIRVTCDSYTYRLDSSENDRGDMFYCLTNTANGAYLVDGLTEQEMESFLENYMAMSVIDF